MQKKKSRIKPPKKKRNRISKGIITQVIKANAEKNQPLTRIYHITSEQQPQR